MYPEGPAYPRPQRVWLQLFVAIALVVLSATGSALEPRTSLSQYAHQAWRTQDGVFAGPPTAIAQTSDGFLWVGTYSSLYRFDGVSFTSISELTHSAVPSMLVASLFSASDGSLWIGTDAKILHYSQGSLREFSARGRVNGIAQTPDGVIWIARARITDAQSPLCHVDRDTVTCIDAGPKLPDAASTLASDRDGNLWIGSTDGIVVYRGGAATAYHPSSLHSTTGFAGVSSILPSPTRNDAEIGFMQTGRGLGLQHFDSGRWSKPAVRALSPENLRVNHMMRDKSQSLWIGTDGQGLYRLSADHRVEHMGTLEGLTSDTIFQVLEDRESGLWVVTARGLDHLHDLPVITYSTHEGMQSDYATSINRWRDQRILISEMRGFDVLAGGQLRHISLPKPPMSSENSSAYVDHQQTLWFGEGNNLWSFDGRALRRIAQPDSASLGPIRHIAESSSGMIYAATISGSLFAVDKPSNVARPVPLEYRISEIVPSRDGGLWVSGRGRASLLGVREPLSSALPVLKHSFSGLVETKDGLIIASSEEHLVLTNRVETRIAGLGQGLPCTLLGPILLDSSSNVWLSASCGYVQYQYRDLMHALHNASFQLEPSLILGGIDGAAPTRADFGPSALLSADNTILFATETGLQQLNPALATEMHPQPEVVVTKILADAREIALGGGEQIPIHSRTIEIDYTTPELTNPSKIRFRYRLDGYDDTWQDAGQRRQAIYTNLPPGHYRFVVEASDAQARWRGRIGSVAYVIPPAWYQRRSIQSLAYLFLVGVLVAIYQARLHAVARSLAVRFEERMQERTRVARDLHDTMLQTVEGSRLLAEVAMTKPSDSNELQTALSVLLERLQQAAREGRSALLSLRDDEAGLDNLDAAIRSLLAELALPPEVQLEIETIGECRPIIVLAVRELSLITLEAVRNALAHAKPSKVKVRVLCRRNVEITIDDDGFGLPRSVLTKPVEGHYGLKGMHERSKRLGAKLRIESGRDRGTSISIAVPGRLVYRRKRRVFQALVLDRLRP